ncbi:MAG TPA: B-box zinc finger protein [Chloroflexota bacterium]|nr:B-box zinc finger protein [Chloroflexota bacterium]
MSTAMFSPGGTVRCARHPNTETVLRCGRCNTPICPRCLVGTPVGARCPTCAGIKRFSINLKPRELARAVGYGIGVSAAGTILVALIPLLAILGPLIEYMVIGFVVGEGVSRGANRKRVPELGPIAVACLFVGYALAVVVLLVSGGQPIGPELLLAPILLLSRGGLMLMVGLLVGALLAWMRVR